MSAKKDWKLDVDGSTWIALLVAVIAAVTSLTSAAVAGRFALKARAAEAEAARLRALEERLAERKFELYKPIIQALGNLMLPNNEKKAMPVAEKAMPEFMNFAVLWASDEVLEAFFRFRIASSTEPPVEITLRLVADFILAARQDLIGTSTSATAKQLIGMRINDLYKADSLLEALTLPFEDLASKHGWEIPWVAASRD